MKMLNNLIPWPFWVMFVCIGGLLIFTTLSNNAFQDKVDNCVMQVSQRLVEAWAEEGSKAWDAVHYHFTGVKEYCETRVRMSQP